MKNPPDKTLKAKADKLCSQAVRTIGYCENCGAKEYSKLQNSHIISRSYTKTRFDYRNLQCLCASCHGTFTKNPIMFADFVTRSPMGLYIDHMNEIANSIKFKCDFGYWIDLAQQIIDGELTVFEARDLLGFQYVGLKF